MSTLRLVLGDQLTDTLSSLRGINPKTDTVLMCEVWDEASYVPHHKQKIAFVFSAMRHFAAQLLGRGVNVRYVTLDDAGNTGSLQGELARAIKDLHPEKLVVTQPGEYRLAQIFGFWSQLFGMDVEIRPDDRFLCSLDTFRAWAKGRKQLRMEYFYRDMRRSTGLLMEPDGTPTGGVWNYDKDNRKPPARGMSVPKRPVHAHCAITRDVLALVAARFDNHFGTLEPFNFPVTRKDALNDLHFFIQQCLPLFGDYQDAMVAGEPFLYHSRISAALNAGLLLPREVCELAQAAYNAGRAPLNAVEGFIRQVLGWREYVRGLYWHFMPDYAELNFFEAKNPLPDFYWSADTQMFCVAEAVRHTRDHAYSHHIQRLMVTGNFALLAGIDPKEVCAWYLAVYADAYEWVELPNTLGMALFGDGGIMASKPYAASGKYIQRMSNSCQNCRYDPQEMTGDTACPFNSLYWDFLARNQQKLRTNPRMANMFATWNKMSDERREAIREQAKLMLERMGQGGL